MLHVPSPQPHSTARNSGFPPPFFAACFAALRCAALRCAALHCAALRCAAPRWLRPRHPTRETSNTTCLHPSPPKSTDSPAQKSKALPHPHTLAAFASPETQPASLPWQTAGAPLPHPHLPPPHHHPPLPHPSPRNLPPNLHPPSVQASLSPPHPLPSPPRVRGPTRSLPGFLPGLSSTLPATSRRLSRSSPLGRLFLNLLPKKPTSCTLSSNLPVSAPTTQTPKPQGAVSAAPLSRPAPRTPSLLSWSVTMLPRLPWKRERCGWRIPSRW